MELLAGLGLVEAALARLYRTPDNARKSYRRALLMMTSCWMRYGLGIEDVDGLHWRRGRGIVGSVFTIIRLGCSVDYNNWFWSSSRDVAFASAAAAAPVSGIRWASRRS